MKTTCAFWDTNRDRSGGPHPNRLRESLKDTALGEYLYYRVTGDLVSLKGPMIRDREDLQFLNQC